MWLFSLVSISFAIKEINFLKKGRETGESRTESHKEREIGKECEGAGTEDGQSENVVSWKPRGKHSYTSSKEEMPGVSRSFLEEL